MGCPLLYPHLSAAGAEGAAKPLQRACGSGLSKAPHKARVPSDVFSGRTMKFLILARFNTLPLTCMADLLN